MTRESGAARAQDPAPRLLAGRNVLADWSGYAVAVVVNFVLSPLVVHHLGPSAYGVWTLLLTVTAYLGWLDFGVRSAVTRYVARCQSQADHGTASSIVSTALALFCALAGVAVLASVGIGLAAPRVFQITVEQQPSIAVVAGLAGTSTAVALLTGVFGGVIVGVQRFDLLRGIEICVTLLRAGLVLGVIRTGGGLLELASVQVASSTVGGVLTAWLSLRVYPQLRARLLAWNWAHLRLIVSYGGYTFIAHLSGDIVNRASLILIGVFRPTAAVTVFAIALTLADYARALGSGIRTALTPLASALDARGQRETLRDTILIGARYHSMLLLPIAATFVLRGGPFIGLWMGPEYSRPSGDVLAVLAVRLSFLGATGAAISVMVGAGRHRPVAAVMVGEAMVNLALGLALVGPFGVLGVAWGVTLPSVAASILVWPWYLHRSFGLAAQRYLVSSWLRPGIAVSPFAGATWLLEHVWPAPSPLVFLAQMAAVLPVALLGYWFLCLSASERQRCLGLVVRST